jgi:hypothetical protein
MGCHVSYTPLSIQGDKGIREKNLKKVSSPFFERFFILGGPRGFRQKKLQKLRLMQLDD